jgi:DNA-binding MurR/RpiR family transcriptional regulator
MKRTRPGKPRPGKTQNGHGPSVAERLRAQGAALTGAERKIAQALLAHYPASGLAPAVELAARAGVSAPSVVRFVTKLGYPGYADFQRRLRHELESADAAQDTGFAAQAAVNVGATLREVDAEAFEGAVTLLANGKRPVYLIGGRFTDALARYMATHLAILRGGVKHSPSNTGAWCDQLLDIKRNDVLVAFDVRVYQEPVIALVKAAARRGATVILMTDETRSPAARHAAHILRARTEGPCDWRSNVGLLALVETLIAAVTARLGSAARDRIADYERMRDAASMMDL